MLHHQKKPDRVREMHEHRVLQQTQQSAPSEGQPTRRSSEQEPADSLRDKSNVIGGWLPSLTFCVGRFAHFQ